MTDIRHLSEDQRQGAADGTLENGRLRAARAHLETCASCAADVARMEALMMRVRESPGPSANEDDLWPAIRARIDASKVVKLDKGTIASTRVARRRPWLAIGSTAVAAALLIAAFAEMKLWVDRTPVAPGPPPDVAFASAADSARSYEDESRRLLNELAMQRAMMGPSTSKSLDADIAIIDRSIAEQKEALVRDPRNIALQRLLASSYREKVELLKRANNAS